MRDQETGRDPLRAEPDEIGRDHHQVPRQAICPDAPDQEEDDRRQRPRDEDEPERGRRVVDPEDGERERDAEEAVAEERGRAREVEEAERPLAEDVERPRSLQDQD